MDDTTSNYEAATMPIATSAAHVAERNAHRRLRVARFHAQSKSTTVPQLSQTMISQWCFDVSAAAIFAQPYEAFS